MSSGIPIELDSAVTTIIIQRPNKHQVEAYENWLREIVPLAQSAPGHRGVNIIRPHGTSDEYTIVLHFSSETNLRNWLDSDTRRRLIEQVRPLLNMDETIEVKTGLEFWFTPPKPSGKTAPSYKQFLITVSAIYPLSMVVPWLLSPVFSAVPFLSILSVRALLTSAVIVGLMTFVIMPRYVRLVAKWLFR
ncbi:antibiotic biosynthesis monooxygenase [Spirosoma aerolatum]|uniref:antibiotic biosynthesis monooxygenase n=1 Tax=Spirosoma aerolatum TaxID=1211326 RepID=UPI0009AD2322|nr:antibiotic biosynthesis monooxygenase [Spirosoma aerolatum]